MVRGILCFGGLMLVAVTALIIGLQKTGKIDVVGSFRPLPEVDATFQRGFRSDAMSLVNRLREPAELGAIRGDEELQAFLIQFVEQHPDPANVGLDEVFAAIQGEFPGAQYLAANLITSTKRDELLNEFSSWSAAANSDFDTITTAVFRTKSRLATLAVLSRRIPEFSLSDANRKGGRFFNRCPHCEEIHALELDRGSRTLILSCPYCDKPFDVLAVDTAGMIRRATDFFDKIGLKESPDAPTKESAESRIVKLWKYVADRCEYQLDQDHSQIREVWKTSRETWLEEAGDCEDTSILLADILITAGFDARVAIGWNGNIGQHAWVVVKVGDEQYVLESTLQSEITAKNLATVEDSAVFYQPEQLFDRERLYYTSAKPEQFTKDYFSPEVWKSIPLESERLTSLTTR